MFPIDAVNRKHDVEKREARSSIVCSRYFSQNNFEIAEKKIDQKRPLVPLIDVNVAFVFASYV